MGRSRFSYRLILLPSFAGLACYGCGPNPNAVMESGSTDANRPDVAQSQLEAVRSSPDATSSIFEDTELTFPGSVSSDAYQEGLNLALSADALSQTALSPDDWDLIASRWQRAIDSLTKVSKDSEYYSLAQRKIAEYTLSAEAATDQLTQLRSPVYIPLPAEAKSSDAERLSDSVALNPTSSLAASSPTQPTQIPIVRRLHGTPVVLVTFNGMRTYEMILDTGASRTLITRQMANELGVVPTERMLAATASQAEVSFDIGQMSSISMGNVELRNTPVTIGDAVSLGLLGNDFLQGYDVTIRAQENVVELVRSL
ncbi:MAG: retropepsin-like aspartic protease [Cyanobacteria bacterium J06621_11]